MNKFATIRSALAAHTAEIAEALNAAPDDIPGETLDEAMHRAADAVTRWLIAHRSVLDSVISAYEEVPIETVARRPLIIIAIKLARIDEAELASHSIGLGDLYDLIMSFASPPPQRPDNVIQLSAYRER